MRAMMCSEPMPRSRCSRASFARSQRNSATGLSVCHCVPRVNVGPRGSCEAVVGAPRDSGSGAARLASGPSAAGHSACTGLPSASRTEAAAWVC
jgi:hypothetical protein